MIAALAVETGIPISMLLVEPDDYLEAMLEVAVDRAKAADPKAGGPDVTGLAARMSGR